MQIILQLGETVTNADCTKVMTCDEGGDLEEVDLECIEHASCGITEGGFRACICDTGKPNN